MKTLVFPDTHGRRFDLILAQEIGNVDKVIFLGDYWDSFDIPYAQQLEVFNTILDFKRSFPDKIVLLLGNHDVQYLYPQYRCSGHQSEPAIPILMKHNKNLFHYAWAYEDYLFSHAGVSQSWLEYVLYKYNISWPYKAGDYEEILNWEFKEIFWIGEENGGSDNLDGPLWIRPGKLVEDLPSGIIQIVGHTYSPWGQYYETLDIIDRGIPSVYNI